MRALSRPMRLDLPPASIANENIEEVYYKKYWRCARKKEGPVKNSVPSLLDGTLAQLFKLDLFFKQTYIPFLMGNFAICQAIIPFFMLLAVYPAAINSRTAGTLR